MKLLHFLKNALRRGVPLILLAAVTVGVFYAVAQNPDAGDETPGADTGTFLPGTNGQPSDTPVLLRDTEIEIPALPTVTVQTAFSKDQLLSVSPEQVPPLDAHLLADAGFSLSNRTYAKNTHVLALADLPISLPDTYSLTFGTVYELDYVRETEMSAPVAVYTETKALLPAIEPYMGYLMLSTSVQTDVYSADGVLLASFPFEEYLCANTRDPDGNPIFYKDTDGVRQYFRIDTENGGFIPSDYVDSAHNRGAYFDYPASYGLSDNGLGRIVLIETMAEKIPIETEAETDTDAETETETESDTEAETETETEAETDTDAEPIPEETEPQPEYEINVLSETTLWAYGYSPARRKTGYYYTEAYNFSDGMACVLDTNGRMQFLNESCYYAFTTRKSYYYHDWYVVENLLPPLTAGEESIGFFYYDHGLIRARRQVTDWSFADRVAIDEDILIDKTGAEFPVPEGYDIISYSDGMILLERDGKYGYMDYTGAWIAQPIYDFARPFIEGLAVVGFESGERLMIDTAGEIVIPAGVYTHISDASSGVIAAYSSVNGWDVLYKMAKFTEG